MTRTLAAYALSAAPAVLMLSPAKAADIVWTDLNRSDVGREKLMEVVVAKLVMQSGGIVYLHITDCFR